MQDPFQNNPQIELKRVFRELILEVWGLHFGAILGVWGLHFGAILGVWAGSGSQGRLGRHLGRLQGGFRPQHGPNLGPKMAPSWSQNRIKNDAKIYHFLGAFKNVILKDLGSILDGKWSQVGAKIGSKIALILKCVKNARIL